MASPPDRQEDRLFVYGTLGPGRPNEHIMQEIGGRWQDASIRGTLVEKGWGASMGYPAIRLDKQGPEVEGFLFSSNRLEQFWEKLDEFEGEAYERVLTEVELKDGSHVEAYVYQLKYGQ